INEKWGEEIGDAIWWIHEKIVGIGDWFTEFKEDKIEKILAGVDWAKEKVETVKQAISQILDLKDRILGGIVNRIGQVKDNVVNNVTGFFGTAQAAVTNATGTARSFVGNAASSITSGISGGLS